MHAASKATTVLKKIGQKISRIGDVIQQPRLLKLRLQGTEVRMFESLNKPWLLNSSISTIFDIGANTGQFARAIHEVLPDAFIYSFEPLGDCFAELQRTMCNVRNFRAFQIALADRDGEEVFYRSEWSPSSSLLPMGRLHQENFPFTAKQSKEVVQIRKLDSYLPDLAIKDDILVKIDVQGSEDKVIHGANLLLSRAKVLIVETSMVPLYQGQPLFRDIFTILENQGFHYAGALCQALSPMDGSVLYSDSVFKRQDPVDRLRLCIH